MPDDTWLVKEAIDRLLDVGFSQLRTRLVLLVLLAVIPALILTLSTGVAQKRRAANEANREFLNVMKLTAAEQERIIDGARQLLGVLVHVPEVRSLEPTLCDPLLAGLLKQNPVYANFGITDRNGMILCSGLPMGKPISVVDRLWFKRAVETRAFAVGDFQISRTAHVPTVHFACPFFDDDGKVLGVAFAALDLKWVSQLLARAHLQEGTVSTLVDMSGTILARNPDPENWVGKMVADTPLLKTVLARTDPGTVETAGVDGVMRLYAFTPLKESGGTIAGYLILGIPSDLAYADANRVMVRNLVFLAVVGVFAIAAAWGFAGSFVLRRTNELIVAANRLRAGDLSSRTRPDHRFGEFTDVAKAFDEMAEALEQRIVEIQKTHAELRLDESRLEALLKLNAMTEAPMKEITDFALEEAVRLTQSKIGYLAFLNEDESVLTMHSWSKSAMAECAIDRKPIVYPVATTGLWGEAVRQRRPVITNDYEAPNPLKKGYPSGHVHVTRHMNAPVFEGERIVVVAGVGNKETNYDQSDVRQLTLLMQGMWRLIQRKRAEDELQQHREHLEELVTTRTAALKETNEQLNGEITERKQAESALRQAVADLQKAQDELKSAELLLIQAEKMETIGRMAAGVAHEVKNPLAILMMSLDFLSFQLPSSDAVVKEVLSDMRKAVNRADIIIRGLLDFSAPNVLELAKENLNEIVKKALLLVKHPLNTNHIELVTQLDSNLPEITLDGSKVEQVFLNLFSNAIDAMPNGGTLTVKTRFERLAERTREPGKRDRGRFHAGDAVVIVEVGDTGCGIPADKLRKIFDPFFTTKETGKGTGLGLTVASRIIEMHDGEIEISNRPEGGVMARVIFKSSGAEKVPAQRRRDSIESRELTRT